MNPRGAVVGALVAAALMVLLCVANVSRVARSHPSGEAYVRTFDNADAPLRATLATGDGQAYAALASDPTLARPGVFRGGRQEASYRAQRPLPIYLAWVLSGGQPALVPWAMLIIAVAGVGLAGYGLGRLLMDRGGDGRLGAVAAIVPSSIAAAQWLGPDPLALALVLIGLSVWRRSAASGGLVLALAGLARETMLLAPLALAAHAAWRRDVRRAALALASVVPWMVWIAFLRLRLGVWPGSAAGGRLSAPFRGMAWGIDRWLHPLSDGAWLVIAVAAAGLAVWRWRDPVARVMLAFACFAALMGGNVWLRWEDFTRPLAPLYALGVVLLLGPNSPGTNAASGTAQTALQ